MLTNTFYASSYPSIIFLIQTNANLRFLSLLFPVVIVPANTYILLLRSTRHAYLTLLLLEPCSLVRPVRSSDLSKKLYKHLLIDGSCGRLS